MTEAEAIRRAREVAASHGWKWVEPTRATRSRVLLLGPSRWHVTSNAAARGRNVAVVLDDATGATVSAVVRPR